MPGEANSKQSSASADRKQSRRLLPERIILPADWKGKEIFAHFGSVTSNMYLWVNGRYVGYSEDSKLEAEFNLTNYLKPGKT